MFLIKFFTNDKIVFFMSLIILVLITKNINIEDIHASKLIIFILGVGFFSYLISICIIIIFLILTHLVIRRAMDIDYNSLSFFKKMHLIANTLETYEDNLNSIKTLILYIHKNQYDNY